MIEMSKMKEMKKLTLGSVQYVHDPEAAQKWFDLYIECVKEKVLKETSKMMDKRILKIKKEVSFSIETNSCLL